MQVATPRVFCPCGERATVFGRNPDGETFNVCRSCYAEIKRKKAVPQSISKFASGLQLDDEEFD